MAWEASIMPDLDFLRCYPSDGSSLSITFPDGTVSPINNLNTAIIGQRCPLLQLSFESSASGVSKASIEASSMALVIHFIRFLYLGDYLYYEDCDQIPCSLLIHAELCRMADIYEVPELQVAAHANIIRETEFSCSQPTAPLDLCAAIRFIYENLSEQKPLIDTVTHYCCHSFVYHKLGTNPEFRKLAYDVRPFHRDLCRTNFERDFQDEGAIAIVNLPVCRPNPPTDSDELDKHALGDFLFELWCESDETPTYLQDKVVDRARKRRKMYEEAGFTLVHRPKDVKILDRLDEDEVTSNKTSFTSVPYRSKLSKKIFDDEFEDGAPSSSAESASESESQSEAEADEEGADLEASFVTIKPTSAASPKGDEEWNAIDKIRTPYFLEEVKVDDGIVYGDLMSEVKRKDSLAFANVTDEAESATKPHANIKNDFRTGSDWASSDSQALLKTDDTQPLLRVTNPDPQPQFDGDALLSFDNYPESDSEWSVVDI